NSIGGRGLSSAPHLPASKPRSEPRACARNLVERVSRPEGSPRRRAPRGHCGEASRAPVTTTHQLMVRGTLLPVDEDTSAAELVALRGTAVNGDGEVVVGARLTVIDRLDGERAGHPVVGAGPAESGR